MKKLTMQEIKTAMRDPSFRKKLPPELKDDIRKYEENPGCPCNLPIYRNVLKYAYDVLVGYYPHLDVPKIDEFIKLSENNWSIINCNIDELEAKLKALHATGRKQLAIARYEDKVTVVINELDVF